MPAAVAALTSSPSRSCSAPWLSRPVTGSVTARRLRRARSSAFEIASEASSAKRSSRAMSPGCRQSSQTVVVEIDPHSEPCTRTGTDVPLLIPTRRSSPPISPFVRSYVEICCALPVR